MDYIINCGKQESLPRRIYREVGRVILWASKAFQREFLERFCTLHTFIFTFPKANGKSTNAVKSLSQAHMSLIQNIEIHMDLVDKVSSALSMLSRGKTNRKMCRVVLRNEYGMVFGFLKLDVTAVMGELTEFETVVVKYDYERKSIVGSRPRWYMEMILGPAREYFEGDTVYHEFHPRRYLALSDHDQYEKLYVEHDWSETDS